MENGWTSVNQGYRLAFYSFIHLFLLISSTETIVEADIVLVASKVYFNIKTKKAFILYLLSGLVINGSTRCQLGGAFKLPSKYFQLSRTYGSE